nr:nuclear factor related to kappa-B-binding protein-like isoform X3 [Oncorhynchus nerka]
MYRELCAKSQKKRQLYSLQQYYHKLLKQILVSRKELLELAVRSGPDIAVKRKCPAWTPGEMQEQRVRGRVCWILREVKTECGDRYPSSDDDASSLPTPRSPSSPTPTVFVRVLPSLSTQDMKTTAKPELGEKDMRAMLRRHREKRRLQPDHPDLMTSDIHLGDLMSRVDVGRKGAMMALFGLARPKRKMRRKKMRRKKMRRIKVESEDPCQALMPSEAPALSLDIPAALPDTPVPPLPSVKEEPLGEVQNSPVMAEEIAVTFFNLLENILRLEGLASTAMLEEKVQQWQTSPASSLNSRFSSASCWSEMVLPALYFLAGETKVGMMALPSGFTPCVAFKESSQQWKWIGPSENGEKDLSALCQLWVDSKGLVVVKAEFDKLSEMTSPTPRASWTDYVVRASTGDERHIFQVQEQQRYDQPHKAFTFRMHGFESQVGPVKGVFDKEMSLNKAREHTLLRSDRPAYVTILSLVRDAAARLPNGEGTRAEICELLKDSQFLAPDVTSAQVNMVVSGALDRLHYEKDPCVKYDIVRKLWNYLHRDRGQEEFEKIHQAQAAAAKARKTLQQKPKLASKPSGSKEGGGKTSGGLEASHMGGPMSPTPSTLGTPKSPLAPVATTPTKTGIPDLVKTGPGVLLVSPPPIPQLGTLLSSSQCGPQVSQPATSQHSARVVGHQSGSPPRVRVVSAQTARGQQAMLVHQTPRQIRVPVTVGVKGITQTVASFPLRTLSFGSPIQGQAARGQTTLSMSGLTTAQTGFPGSPAHHTASPAVLQGVTSQNVIQQVAITGQMGVKAQGGAAISKPATDLRIQDKDVLRLPPYSITTDSKGQTVLRITPEMMATLTKSPVTTTKLNPDMLGTATTKSISATLHLTPPQHSSPCSPASSGGVLTNKASAGTTTLLKAAGDAMAEQKDRTFSTVSSSDSKSGTPIRIMPRLGVIPQKWGQAITVTTTTCSKPVSTGAATVPKATSGVAVAEGVTIGPSASGSLTLGTATATVHQVPVTATVVSTQPRKLPARIPVPLSVLCQPLKSKSRMTTPILKGNISTNISSLGRNIILTTMPAGTKLIAGNKPVRFVTEHQLQQLQQQGQATQVRIQTVPALQLQQLSAAGSPKSVSAAVVTTAPSPKRTPDPPPPAQ